MTCPYSNKHGNDWPPRSRPRTRFRRGRLAGWTLIPLALVLTWHVWAQAKAQPWIYPTPLAVADQLVHPQRDHFHQGSLALNTFISLLRVLIAFGMASVAGVGLGVVMGASRIARSLLEPLTELLRPLCPIAWLPFALAVFGLTALPGVVGIDHTGTVLDHIQLGMLFVLAWGAFFPILINTMDGVAGVRKQYVALAWTLGASRMQCFRHVYLPAALPMILTGLRQGIGMCWFVIIAAEMLPGSACGIGYLLMYASDQMAMDVVIAAMILVGGIGALLNLLMVAAMNTFVRWHGKEA